MSGKGGEVCEELQKIIKNNNNDSNNNIIQKYCNQTCITCCA